MDGRCVSFLGILFLLARLHVFASCYRCSKRYQKSKKQHASFTCGCRKRCHYLYEEVAQWNSIGTALILSMIIIPLMLFYQARAASMRVHACMRT